MYFSTKVGKASSLFFNMASIYVMHQSMVVNLLNGNLQNTKVGDLWADASSSTVLLISHSATWQRSNVSVKKSITTAIKNSITFQK